MATLQVGKDYETSERAGAGGMFQVDTLIDENDDDVTNRIDVGMHFSDEEQLKEYLSQIFGIPVADIDLDDM
jgi:type I restriction enzyme S subunit